MHLGDIYFQNNYESLLIYMFFHARLCIMKRVIIDLSNYQVIFPRRNVG